MAGSEPEVVAGAGPVTAALLGFERVAVAAEAVRVAESGARTAEHAAGLSAALDAAAVAAGGVQAGAPGGLLSGPALAECAALLARRARDAVGQAEELARGMGRAADLLVDADEEVAGDVAGAAG
ncbi:hypothetical protein [Dietzia sp. PP-33]|jgi:hypothetical protein|uniref:hypothetical protein n=1 Tax=Dietzia sp. PP-33 TaxID=2957500 RepID=UPI0029B80439|nr:hypothetical protein [Dietzia sp. PP-33]MDX2356192.1 hypothetical protein [Dietzia sp. PP-33]